ncbi:DUF4397 domain-containing protein [Natronosalvus rutilus]|uniref:DUF4397 domain-containing protein n=1 Tax=Natronosalvus rutilus TaxID=2953753 RepID=A0A9E7NBT7_9EURY|nr:DUF4397 domain-containing protein [Natronosalvus rutilus]UTF53797.1 DUF4397 domain-containing protein [Natronosalvus rutilus]
MPLSRRRTLAALGIAGGTATTSGIVFGRGEHDDDERERDPGDQEANGPSEREAPLTAVRVAHLSPDAPGVDILVDGERVVSGLEYDTLTPYLELEPGTATITVTAADDADTVVFEREYWFGQAFYTVAAIGELETGTIRPHVLIDDGSVLFRAVHGSPDAPAVDLYANDGDNPIVADLAYGETSNYVAVPAAEYALDVRPAGNPGTTVASVDLDLERGGAYTGYAVGALEPDDGDAEFTIRATLDGPMAAPSGR